jgi:hypothetical protein
MEPVNTALAERAGADDDEALLAPHTELQVELAGTRERLGIPDPDMHIANQEIPPGVAELEQLRHAIHEQEQAKLEALQEAAELHTQLAAVQEGAAKPKTQYYGVPKSRGALTRVESELAETTTKLHAAKKQLDWEQRARRAESIKASAKISKLEKELAEATEANIQAQSESHPMRLRLALGAVAALGLAAGIAAFAMHRQIPVSAYNSATAEREPVGAAGALSSQSASSAPDFTKSYDRLGQALAALPGRDPEDVLRQLQMAGKGCAIRWNGGEPSLLFGGLGKKPASFGEAMTQCAEAVEKLH